MDPNETISLTRTTDLAFGEPGQMVTIPRQVGPVRLERQLGQGAMGVVWLGTDELLHRRVAVKFLLTAVQGPDDPRLIAFLEGARAAAALRHANLTNILHAATVETVPYLVMEYVDGPSLSSLIRKGDPLTPAELIAVMTDACNAVGHLHDQQRIHRDIKPSNILIDRDGNAFVTDFGLSRELASRPGVLKEGGASIAGTPAYMAPEMFEGQISAKSDVYALGVTAFELLAGETPFTGTLEDIRACHATQPPPIDKLAARGVSEPLADAIDRALNKSPLYRHKTPGHFLAALTAACGGPQMVARGRQALFDRFIRTAPDAAAAQPGSSASALSGAVPASLPTPPPPTPGQTYYDRLTVIAEQKRREDSDLEIEVSPPPAPPPAVESPINPVLFGPQDPDYPIWPLVIGLALAGVGALQAILGPIAIIGLVARPTGGPFSSVTPAVEPGAGWLILVWTATALEFLFGLALVVIAIGFMMHRTWALHLARIWSWSRFLLAALAAALVYAAARRAGTGATGGDTVFVTALATFALEAIVPAMLLGWLHTPTTRAQTATWK